MALIACPDCGRQVSDLAPACPQCARPIADTFAPPKGRATPDLHTEGVAPGVLARRHRDRIGARTPGVSKACMTCGRDVSEDLFRAKRNAGYVCAECQDKEIDRYVAFRDRWGKVVWVALALVVASVAIVCVIAVVSGMSTSKSDAVEPVKK